MRPSRQPLKTSMIPMPLHEILPSFDKTHTYTSSVTTVGCQLRNCNCNCNCFLFLLPRARVPVLGSCSAKTRLPAPFPRPPIPPACLARNVQQVRVLWPRGRAATPVRRGRRAPGFRRRRRRPRRRVWQLDGKGAQLPQCKFSRVALVVRKN